MNDAADSRPGPAPLVVAVDDAATGTRKVHHGRLFRKYLLLILTLVTIALLASGGVSLYFTYQETKSALASLQHEKALAAASRIEQYMHQIERQLAYAALPQLDASDVELRRIELLKLLRQAPEVTDIAQLDAGGREQIAVSRLGMDSVGSGRDRSEEAAFREAKRGRAWFGPVYFRKETEPYMTIAMRSGGDRGPVTIADVNLKFIWDVVSRIRIGEQGKAYVVDNHGFLVADPDIGLVLRKTNLANLAHVQAAARPQSAGDLAMVSTNLAGSRVLTSVAPIESLNWNVFVEQPVAEVYAKLNASILRTALLLLVGFVVSALGALALARGMVRPIRTLEEGAQRIGGGDLDQRIDVRTGDELESLAAGFNRMSSQLKESYAGLECKVEVRTRELQNSLEQQTAISEILRVISSSPTNVQPVLDAVAEHAAHLCAAPFARVMLGDGNELRSAAQYSSVPTLAVGPLPLKRTSIAGRAMLDLATLHYADVVPLLDDEFPDARENVRRNGCRAVLAVPLLREGGAYGAIFLFRREPGLFSPDQVALVETFARQAAIAIDNVRLFNETKEALEHQKASAEVLGAISSSIADTRPVFDEILQSCQHLFDGHIVGIVLVGEDGMGHDAGYLGGSKDALKEIFPVALTLETGSGTAVVERRVVHYPDVAQGDVPATTKRTGELLGFRSALFAPLLLEGRALGVLWVGRKEQAPFSEKQIALLETFADQAVIAIENARLFNETREALEQQTAISEILRVISSSPGDVRPMLNAVAQRARVLCDAAESGIFFVDGDRLRFAAGVGSMSIPEENASFPLTRGLVVGRAVIDRQTLHYADIVPLLDIEYPDARANQQRYGFRALLAVPLMREDRAIGSIALWRTEPRAFSDKQIALVRTFADQAAIAIENVRLFNETREALEQQTAIADILQVISSSVADTAPVFEKILDSCQHLFATEQLGIFLVRDGQLHVGAFRGDALRAVAETFPLPLADTATGVAIRERRTLHIAYAAALPDAPDSIRKVVARIGDFSAAWAPMLWEDQAVGSIGIVRRPPAPFSAKELTLLKTFADQAVIAIQNARLFRETKEALEQQTAVAEILRVISGSPTDVQPVLEAIAERASKLCDASASSIYLIEGDAMKHLASKGPSADPVTHVDTVPIDRASLTGCAVLERRTIQVPDLLAAGDQYPLSHDLARRLHHRTVLVTPLLREGEPFGAILLRRQEVRPFSEREVALLRTFGDQAAIAIENVRLFNETREALEQQRASGEVLAAISNSIADTSPVFETILASCERLFAGRMSVIDLVGEDGRVHLGAYHGPRSEEVKSVYPHTADATSATGAAIAMRRVVHYAKIEDVPETARRAMEAFGIRAAIGAPMIWEGKGIGAIWVARDHAGPFSSKEIALLKSFADQAVIAIQNARLFREIQDKSRQLEVANKHKSDFLASMSHELRTPLNAIIGFSEVLLERLFGDVNAKQDDYLKDIHSSGRHLLTLINDILDLSKIEAGRMDLEPSSFNVALAVSNALTLVRERAQRHGIALGQQVDPALCDIVADERKFKQILLNLLSNAVKFTPDGGRIDVTARLADRHAEIAVRDTGIGIAAADQAAVFEEFRQVGSDYTKKQEGTGLGLALTRKFVELHGGTIWLDSTPGQGSTFTFTIPLRP